MTTHVHPLTTSKTLGRLGIVLAGGVAALLVWLLFAAVETPSRAAFGGAASTPVTAPDALLAAVLGGLVGWASLVALERLTVRAVPVWRALAWTALLVSLVGPSSGEEAGIASRLALVLMHVAVAAVVIPLLPLVGSDRSETLR
jgi:hypothetical protein